VQINVGRDLHSHGGCSGHADVSPTRVGHGDTLARGLGVLLYNGWRLVLALASVVIALVVFVVSVGVWMLGRSADLMRMSEAALGGAPNRLVFSSVPMRMLGQGNVNELEGLNQLESDYVD
jgi:hypothetical protein